MNKHKKKSPSDSNLTDVGQISLEALGISEALAEQCRQVAAIPKGSMDAYYRHCVETENDFTADGLIRWVRGEVDDD